MKFFYLAVLFLLLFIMGAGRIFGEYAQIAFYFVIILMGLGMAFYGYWFKKFVDKVNALMPLIETEPDTYIEETKKLLESKLPGNIRAMLIMNIAVAHMEKGDFKTALQTLKEIQGGTLKKANHAIYFLNLAYVQIHLGQHEQALEIIKKYKKRFLSLPMGGNLPRLITFVQVFEAMQDNKWEEAEENLKTAKADWPDKVTGVNFAYLEEQLAQHNAETKGKA